MADTNPAFTSDVAVRIRDDIATRLEEIAPLIAEHATLQAALESFDAATAPRAAYGSRMAQVLRVLSAQPGTTPRAIAETLGIDPAKVYAPLRALARDGHAHRDDRRWFPGSAD